MRRTLSMWFLVAAVLVSAQTLGIASAKPGASTGACDAQSCSLCPGGPCGPSCPLPCAVDQVSAASCTSETLPCVETDDDVVCSAAMTLE